MNPVVERMQRAQQYLERAAHLEGTGQPVLCALYTRRAGHLIERVRSMVADQRGGLHATELALERAGRFVETMFREGLLGGSSKGGGS